MSDRQVIELDIGKVVGDSEALCPICHERRKEHGCKATVDLGSSFRTPYRIHLSMFCYHPDTVRAMANAKRYMAIKAPDWDIPDAVVVPS